MSKIVPGDIIFDYAGWTAVSKVREEKGKIYYFGGNFNFMRGHAIPAEYEYEDEPVIYHIEPDFAEDLEDYCEAEFMIEEEGDIEDYDWRVGYIVDKYGWETIDELDQKVRKLARKYCKDHKMKKNSYM